MNLHQDFKMVKPVLIEQWCMFNKIQKQKWKSVYKEKTYNCRLKLYLPTEEWVMNKTLNSK